MHAVQGKGHAPAIFQYNWDSLPLKGISTAQGMEVLSMEGSPSVVYPSALAQGYQEERVKRCSTQHNRPPASSRAIPWPYLLSPGRRVPKEMCGQLHVYPRLLEKPALHAGPHCHGDLWQIYVTTTRTFGFFLKISSIYQLLCLVTMNSDHSCFCPNFSTK